MTCARHVKSPLKLNQSREHQRFYHSRRAPLQQLATVTVKTHFLTSSAVNRKSYNPPWLVGSIKSLIRWISAPRCCILKRNTTTRANLWASALTDVCLKSDYGERETDLEVHCWFLVQLLDLPKAESLKYPGMTGSQQRCPLFCALSLLFPLLCHLQSRKLPSIQTCIILVSRFSSKFKHFTLFWRPRTSKSVKDLDSHLPE